MCTVTTALVTKRFNVMALILTDLQNRLTKNCTFTVRSNDLKTIWATVYCLLGSPNLLTQLLI